MRSKLWKSIELDKKEAKKSYKSGRKGIADTSEAKSYIKGEYDGLNRAQYLVEQSEKKKIKKTVKHKKRKTYNIEDDLI